MSLALPGLVSLAPDRQEVPDRARNLVRRIDARHAGLQDVTARFTQTYRSGMLGREIVERGTVSIKSPGRMRWEYRDPERKTFVSDGRTFYFYVPADRQVIVSKQEGQRSLPALLLSGQGRIADEFDAALEEHGGRLLLRLTPHRPQPDVQQVFVEVDGDARIVSIEILDVQGNQSRFRFEHIRENVGLPDRLFKFEIPRGVEVITG